MHELRAHGAPGTDAQLGERGRRFIIRREQAVPPQPSPDGADPARLAAFVLPLLFDTAEHHDGDALRLTRPDLPAILFDPHTGRWKCSASTVDGTGLLELVAWARDWDLPRAAAWLYVLCIAATRPAPAREGRLMDAVQAILDAFSRQPGDSLTGINTAFDAALQQFQPAAPWQPSPRTPPWRPSSALATGSSGRSSRRSSCSARWSPRPPAGSSGPPTGIGKTHLALGLAAGMATGRGFLHWRAARPARVLYIDGEMSSELLQKRLRDLQRREPGALLATNLFAFSWEDCEELARIEPRLGTFAPLNTPEGQAFMLGLIEAIGGIDVVILDNRMSLTTGDMKEELPWTDTMPLVLELTRRRIAQIWIDHMGHDAKHIYGSKMKEWQFDAVAILESVENAAADISFRLRFTKARRREPSNRADFEPVVLTLAEDTWQSDVGAAPTQVDAKR